MQQILYANIYKIGNFKADTLNELLKNGQFVKVAFIRLLIFCKFWEFRVIWSHSRNFVFINFGFLTITQIQVKYQQMFQLKYRLRPVTHTCILWNSERLSYPKK